MKNFWIKLIVAFLLLVGLLGFAVFAQDRQYQPASQTEVNAGVNTFKGVTPATLAGWTAPGNLSFAADIFDTGMGQSFGSHPVSGAGATEMSCSLFTLGPVPMTGFQLVESGYYLFGGTPTLNPNGYMVHYVIEYPTNVFHQLLWGGQPTKWISPGYTNYFSDISQFTIPAGSNYLELRYIWTTNGTWVGNYVAGQANNTNLSQTYGGSWTGTTNTVTDLTLIGGMTNVFAYCHGHLALFGRRADGGQAPPLSLGVIGDSRESTYSYGYGITCLSVACASNGIPLYRLSTSGNAYQVEATNTLNNQLITHCTDVFLELGINDVMNYPGSGSVSQQSFTQMTNLAMTQISLYKALGARVWMCTLPPNGISPTVNNPTGQANLVLYNNWIRTNNLISGYADLSYAIDPNNNGYWPASETSDGLHPNAAGSTALYPYYYALVQQIKAQAGAVNAAQLTGIVTNLVQTLGSVAAHDFAGNTNLPAPTITVGSGACYAVFTNHSPSDACQDVMVVGTNTVGGILYTVTFGTPFTGGIVPSIIGPLPQNINAQLLDNSAEFIWVTNKTSTSYVVADRPAVGLVNGTVYVFSTMVMH